jgi:putative oxygen-independent coproporphyrinogen III oxidase
MPSALPEGDPAPPDGRLDASALRSFGAEPWGIYVHVPFCATRCGYCDFNTYTSAELGVAPGTSVASYAEVVIKEIELAARVLGRVPPVSTVFFGGGTPTLLDPVDQSRILGAIASRWGLADGAEVTTEANPDSVSAHGLATLREAGFNRISLGMQSAVPAVLATLDRTHDPARVPLAVAWARAAGFDQVSLDLIYGTPGESVSDWESSLDAALSCGPDHVSAYALIVEEGTALARRVRRGELPAPDDDDLADKYLLADQRLTDAGLGWYELSNWARDDAARCRHNELYWRSADWWGFGPGAHSHVGGTRWWNVRHPAAYAGRLSEGQSPAAAREILGADVRRTEDIMLRLRLRSGLPLGQLDTHGRAAIGDLVGRGLVEQVADHVVLTLSGRLLADAVVRDLLAP